MLNQYHQNHDNFYHLTQTGRVKEPDCKVDQVKLTVVVHTCNSGTVVTMGGRWLEVQDQPVLHSESQASQR